MVVLPQCLNDSSPEEIRDFLNSFDLVLSDCDGVLWLGNEVIKDSENTINKLKELKEGVFFVTNNSTKTREEFSKKLNNLGFKAVQEDIICTAYLAAQYLKELNFDKKVYILGGEGIATELDQVGIKHTDIGPDVIEISLEKYIQSKVSLDPEVEAVIIGFDPHFSYPKLVKAASYLANPNCQFIGTCLDEVCPVNSNLVFPGTGCFVKCVEAASGRKALVLGKPNDFIRDVLFKMKNINPSRTLMIGDRCDTDILFGKRCGFQTLLVLSGVHSSSDITKFANSSNPGDHDLVPEFSINKLGDLLPYMS